MCDGADDNRIDTRMPNLSVIITTHARPLFLRRAIGSIKAQSLGDVQTIVVSDTTCPETQRIASALLDGSDLFIQRHGPCGPADSRNVGLCAAEGDHIAFLDDDDAFTERYFEHVRPHLGPDHIVYTNYHVVFETHDATRLTPVAAEARDLGARRPLDLFVKNFIPQHCLIYPAAIVKRCRVDPRLELNEDWDFLLQAAAFAELRHVPIDGPIVYTRDVADNRGGRQNERLEDVYRRIYARHPAPSPAIHEARERLMGHAVPVAA